VVSKQVRTYSEKHRLLKTGGRDICKESAK